jgi:hypothetical protein
MPSRRRQTGCDEGPEESHPGKEGGHDKGQLRNMKATINFVRSTLDETINTGCRNGWLLQTNGYKTSARKLTRRSMNRRCS